MPGETYQIMGYAILGDSLQTYEQIFDFKTAEIEPMDFEIIAPTQDEAFETDNITATWKRAVGAAGYAVEMKQNNELLYTADNINPADTSLSINITEAEFYKDIDLKITALNAFGDKSASIMFSRKFRNGIDEILNKNNNAFTVYPNPVKSNFNVSFVVDKNTTVRIELYNMAGQIQNVLLDKTLEKGKYIMEFGRTLNNGNKIERGNYLLHFKNGNYTTTRTVRFE
jgi:GR25 family glycosyltransferase involved in LPS biosynthesis